MRNFLAFFKLEVKHFFCKRNLVILIIVLIIALSLLQIGINNYKKKSEQRYLFQKLEYEKILTYINYRLYGIYGIRLFFEPHLYSIFSINSAIVNDLNAFIDSGERLNIYAQFIGGNLFKKKKYGFWDFSGVFFYLFTLVSCFYGFETFIYREYLKSIATLSRRKTVFFSIMLSRMVIIALLIAFFMFIAVIQSMANGLRFPIDSHLLVFYLMILLLSVFFLWLGNALAKIKPMVVSVLFVIICWLFCQFALPAIVNGITEIKSDSIEPQYKLALKKLKTFTDFEKQAINDKISYKPGETLTEDAKKRVLSYLDKEAKEIHEMEMGMHGEMVRTAEFYYWCSMIFPGTYYISITDELSSMGYLNLLDFYLHTIDLKSKFLRFYIQKIYFENFSRVISFLKGDENVYHATSRLPVTFFPGLLIQLGIILVLVLINYKLYIKSLYKINTKVIEEDPMMHPEIRFKYRRHRVFTIKGKMLLNRLYNFFSGKPFSKESADSSPKVYVEDTDISKDKFEESFLYVCSPGSLPPYMSAAGFYNFICDVTGCSPVKKAEISIRLKLEKLHKKKIKDLKHREKAALLLAMGLVTERKVYLIYDLVRGLGRKFTEQFKEILEQLSAKGCLLVYLTGDSTLTEYADIEFNGYLEKTEDWNKHVDEYRDHDIKSEYK